ncbi:hypothetical protein ACJJTC_016645 [Scirpophaga incertulas]
MPVHTKLNYLIAKEYFLMYANKYNKPKKTVRRPGKPFLETQWPKNYYDTIADTSTNIALIVLPLVIKVSPTRKQKKSTWKPSRAEISRGFIVQAASEGEMTTTILEKTEKFKKHGCTVQPYVIFVGSSPVEIKKSKVIDELNILKDKGVNVKTEVYTGVIKLHFAALTGDNLGLNVAEAEPRLAKTANEREEVSDESPKTEAPFSQAGPLSADVSQVVMPTQDISQPGCSRSQAPDGDVALVRRSWR